MRDYSKNAPSEKQLASLRKPKDYSWTRKARTLAMLAGRNDWHEDEFQSLTNKAALTNEQAAATRNLLQRQGLIERRVVLTEKGRAAIAALQSDRQTGDMQ